MIYFTKTLSVEQCRKYPDYTFVFGDNMQQKGKAGQAVIRNEPNAFGIPTKLAPCMEPGCFFSDQKDEYIHVRALLEKLFHMHEAERVIVLPEDPIGSGMAKLNENSPQIWAMIQDFYSWAKGVDSGILPE